MSDTIIHNAMESGDPALAEEAFREFDIRLRSATTANQKATLLLGKAVLCGAIGRFDDAREQLRLALQQSPNDPDIRLQFDFIGGCLCGQEGNLGEGYARLTTVLSNYSERLAQPDIRFMYEDVQYQRGLALARMTKFREAIPLLKESLSFASKLDNRSDILSNLGLCYSELENYESAKDYFLEARKVGLTKEWEGQVHFYLGASYAHLHLFREAKQEFKLCEERVAEYGFPAEKVYGWLSWVSKGLGERVESERYARMAHPN